MVSNVLKPSPSTRGMPTNGAAAGAAKEVVGSNTKGQVETKIKKLRQNGIVNGCSTETHNGASSPSPPPETKRPPTTLTSNQTKTQGAHSNEQSSSTTTLGDQSQRRRLVCPELAIKYTGTLMSNRAGHLVGSQRDLESRYTAVTRKLRQKQLRGVQSHARKQLDFSNKTSSGHVNETGNEAETAPLLKSESELSDMSSEVACDKSEPMELEIRGKVHIDEPLPIQVDGACDERPDLTSNLRELSLAISRSRTAREDEGKEPYHDTLSQTDKDDVFRENESSVGMTVPHLKPGSGHFDNSMKKIQQQLVDLRNLMDGDVTESSDDEEEDDCETSRREASKHNWERTRSLIGSRWAWLNHRMTTLNKDLCRLEHEIQHRPNKERFSFSLPESSTQPSWLALSNNSILSHLNKTSTNGSTPASILSSSLASLQQKGVAGKNGPTTAVKPSNGYTNNHKAISAGGRNGGSGGHGQYYSQLLLSESGIGAKLQVKDLLSPARNFILVDEPGCTSARTRALERKARRRIVRKRQELKRQRSAGCHDDMGRDVTSCTGLDPSPHPILSLPHELPSRVLLDAAVKRVLAEHSYAQLPLNKRRKAAAKLAHISTPRSVLVHSRTHPDHASRMHPDHTSFSESPSPLGTPLSASSDRVKGGSSRKRPSLIHQSSSSCDTPGPWSPGMFRPHTPLNNTPSLPVSKKRRLMSSTPSYDIDNIVIPYSMAATTRVEKLEYKEIITPSWREIGAEKITDEEAKNNEPVDVKEPCDKEDTIKTEPDQTEERKDDDTIDKTTATPNEAPPTDHTPLPEVTNEGEEDLGDEAYTRRHEKCESIEKQKFLNFISGGSRKRTRPHSLASTPDANTARASSPHPLAAAVASSNKGKQKRVLLSPTPSEVELAMIQREAVVPPWTQREFPLNEQDYDALLHPRPPPKLVTVTPSPSPMDTRSTTPTDFKLSRTPSNTSTAVATPLSSPLSTPSEETPAISPSEWTVQLNAQTSQPKATSHFPSLVLRLSKRTV